MNSSASVNFFDRSLYARRRNRAASTYATVDFIKREACERLVDRLEDVRKSFATIVDVGTHHGQLGQVMQARLGFAPTMACDVSAQMLAHVEATAHGGKSATMPYVVVADEEWLPLRDSSVDLLVSALNLHVVNDLVGVLIQMRRALREGGLMMANFIGGASLHELRACLAQAETEVLGGISPRVIPMIDVRDAGDLLSRTGYALPVADSETLSISYPDFWSLVKDVRMMGGANMLHARPRIGGRRELFARAAQLYHEQFSDSEGRITATVELISLTGWRE